MTLPDYTPILTPVEYQAERGIWLKRDDLFCYAGVNGGKVRSCKWLAAGAKMLITASSRHSPQMTIVARIAQRMGIPARCHIATGPVTPEMEEAREAGATLVRHKPGYNSVIIKRAKEDLLQYPEATEIPFGMKCVQAVEATGTQVANLPRGPINRIILCCGSGISMAGILQGIETTRPDLTGVPVIGIQVGADPTKTLHNLAPFGWQRQAQLVHAGVPYHDAVEPATIGPIALDPHYEAKVLRFLKPGDLFWVVGIRRSSALKSRG